MAVIETTIDSQDNFMFHRVKGEVTADVIIEKVKKYPLEESMKYILWDFSEADMTRLSSQGLQSILVVGKEISKYRIGGKTALVLPQDLSFGLGRMFEMMTDLDDYPVQYKSFRNLEDAKSWLGITT